jgi:hypothetical protein
MKTWEMIKELTEHPEKKFKIVKTAIVAYYKKCDNLLQSYIAMEYTDGKALEFGPIVTHGTWEEVIEPVDFLTAYKDCLENGTKYVNCDFKDQSLICLGNKVHLDQREIYSRSLLSGKWIKQC